MLYVNGDSIYPVYVGPAIITINPTNPFIPSTPEDDDDLEEGAIYGIIGGIALLILILLIGFTIYKKRQLRNEGEPINAEGILYD